ncbi:MAG TPA: hypothetical protein VI522_02305 [Gammaproteobacteria bacterium]|nr:hypothetical protein [Gammaproteobacteria bacterium]
MSKTPRTDAVDMLLKSTKCLALELHESIHESHSSHVMAVITEITEAQEEIKRLREAGNDLFNAAQSVLIAIANLKNDITEAEISVDVGRQYIQAKYNWNKALEKP